MTYTLGSATTSAIVFASTSATQQTVTTGGKTLGGVTFSGVGSSYLLSDTNAMGSLTHTSGVLNTGGQTCSWGSYVNTGTATRTLTLGASAIAITGTGTVWSIASVTGMTLTTNTATITFSGAGANMTTALLPNWAGTSIVINSTGAFTFNNTIALANLTYAPSAGVSNVLSFGTNVASFTCTNFTVTGAAAPNRVLVQSSTLGTQRTITVNGSVVLTACDFIDIATAGAGWTSPTLVGGIGDCQGNSANLTAGGGIANAAQTNYYKAAANANFSVAANWFLATNGGGGAGRVPLPQDTANIDGNSGAFTYTLDFARIGSLALTGFTGTLAWLAAGFTCFGNLLSASTATMPSPANIGPTMAGRGSYSLLSAGNSRGIVQCGLTIKAPGGTLILLDGPVIDSTRAINLLAGTLDAATNNVSPTMGGFQTSGALTRQLNMGSGTWTLQYNLAGWQVSGTGFTLNAGTSAIAMAIINTTLGGNTTFVGGGLTYYILSVVSNAIGSAIVITGANSFYDILTVPETQLVLPASTTTTIRNTASTFGSGGTNYGYLNLHAVNSNNATSPNATPLQITGDIDIRVQASMASWTAAGTTVLLAKGTAAGQRSYILGMQTGVIRLDLFHDGTADLATVSTVSVPFAANAVGWIRATWEASSGHTNFYTSTDGVAWTLLGTGNQVQAAVSIFNSTSYLEIGSQIGGTATFTGRIYRAQVYNGIAGTLVFDANFATKPFPSNSFTESSSNGAIVTINGQAAQAGDGRVLIASSTPGTAATISCASGTVSVNNASLQDSTATGGASFTAVNSRLVSNDTGWSWALTQTAVVRVSYVGTKAQSAIVRVSHLESITQSAVARIAHVETSTQSAVVRVSRLGTSTQSAVVRVSRLGTSTQAALVRVQAVLLKTQSAVASISHIEMIVQSGITRVSQLESSTQTAVVRTSHIEAATQGALVRVSHLETATQSAVVRVSHLESVTQTGTANIYSAPGLKYQSANVRVQHLEATTQGAAVRSQIVGTKTQSAIANVFSSVLTKPQSATVRVQRLESITQSANVRVQVIASQGAVTFGSQVQSGPESQPSTSCAMTMSGVISGQPIVVLYLAWSADEPTGISDTFSTPYTWTLVDSLSATGERLSTYIGTGGEGTSGVITLTYASATVRAVAVPCIGASTAPGLSAIDVHGIASGSATSIDSVYLVPEASGEGAVYVLLASTSLSAFPSSPWQHVYES
jgi:hypothetical protein